nr:hypothetical protein B0A51_03831 [Rachicladosporium sp. CCFEE 5018]
MDSAICSRLKGPVKLTARNSTNSTTHPYLLTPRQSETTSMISIRLWLLHGVLGVLLLWSVLDWLVPLDDDIAPAGPTYDAYQPTNLVRVRPRTLITQSGDYKRAVKKGKAIICGFGNPSKMPAARFTKVSDLKDWGWDSMEMTAADVTGTLKNFEEALRQKQLPIASPPVKGVSWRHVRNTTHDSVFYPATGGRYDVLFEPSKGLIVPASSYGPSWYLSHKSGPSANLPPNTPLPKNRQNLHYVVNINCINQTSIDVVSAALKRDGVKNGIPPKWPGHTSAQLRPGPFTRTDAYAAVLGTPNILGSGWLILQHQQQLGKKHVGAITVWDSSGNQNDDGLFQLSVMVEVIPITCVDQGKDDGCQLS